MNKYEKWYDQIIANSVTERQAGYERHHIIPKSLGGTDEPSNLVFITTREHFVCHWLLTKIYKYGEEHWKMLNALRMMRAENQNQQRYETKITSRVYARAKEEYAQLQSERITGENNPMFGDKFRRSEEGHRKHKEAISGDKNGAKQHRARVKISESKRGKKRGSFSEEWIANLSAAHSGDGNGMYGKTHTEDTKQKQREKALGRKQSEETKRKKADAVRGSKREKKLCPHCDQLVAVNGYARWHGDNCKHK
jgi:hypothetical protein